MSINVERIGAETAVLVDVNMISINNRARNVVQVTANMAIQNVAVENAALAIVSMASQSIIV